MPGTGAQAYQALTRFGLGGRAGDDPPTDPAGWLRGQLAGPDTCPRGNLPDTAGSLRLLDDMSRTPPGTARREAAMQAIAALYDAEARAFLANAVATRAPFRERLVWFWANHFAVMAETAPVRATAGAFVREAIRPNVTGSFSDMLLAVIRHPAMLFSLDNHRSVGADSALAKKQALSDGIPSRMNENLGRETLELYTIGVQAGYTQADVAAMACLLTGWSVKVGDPPRGFFYDTSKAQPGRQTLLGVPFPNTQAGCAAALQFLANQPATYRRLATKLATHFVSDTPSAASVTAIADALSSSGGNLAAAARAIVASPDAWQAGAKLRTPQDLVVATFRAAGTPGGALPDLAAVTAALGQPTWRPPFPNGWSDRGVDWTGPEASLLRVDWLSTVCGADLSRADPTQVATAGLGPLLSPATAAGMAAAAAGHDRLTLLLCSPEFQRR